MWDIHPYSIGLGLYFCLVLINADYLFDIGPHFKGLFRNHINLLVQPNIHPLLTPQNVTLPDVLLSQPFNIALN